MGKGSTGRPTPCCAQYHKQQNSPNPDLVFSLMEGAANLGVEAASCFGFAANIFRRSSYKMPEHVLVLGQWKEMLLHLPASLLPSSICALGQVPRTENVCSCDLVSADLVTSG